MIGRSGSKITRDILVGKKTREIGERRESKTSQTCNRPINGAPFCPGRFVGVDDGARLGEVDRQPQDLLVPELLGGRGPEGDVAQGVRVLGFGLEAVGVIVRNKVVVVVLAELRHVGASVVPIDGGVFAPLSLDQTVAVHRVELLVAESPWELFVGGEAAEQEVERVAHDDGVVEVDHGRDGDHAVPHALEARGEAGVDLGAAEAGVLAEDHLHEEEREADD